MNVEDLERAITIAGARLGDKIKEASPEVLAQARELAGKAAPIAAGILAGQVPKLPAPGTLDEALAAADELDEELAEKLANKKAAGELVMAALEQAGRIALKVAIASLA